MPAAGNGAASAEGNSEEHQAFLIALLNRMLNNIAHEGDTNMTGIGERI